MVWGSRSRLGYLKFRRFVVKFPGWDTSSYIVPMSRSRLGYLKFGFVAKISVGISQTFVFSRLGQSKFYDFIIKISNGIPHVSSFHNEDPVRIPKILRFRVQDYGWGSSSFVSS